MASAALPFCQRNRYQSVVQFEFDHAWLGIGGDGCMLICMEARQPGQKYNHMVDMWAFGVLMYLLMYGHYPRLDGRAWGGPRGARSRAESERFRSCIRHSAEEHGATNQSS